MGFLDCLREEQGLRKWKRLLGLKLKRKEEERGGEKWIEGRHGSGGFEDGGLKVRRARIINKTEEKNCVKADQLINGASELR